MVNWRDDEDEFSQTDFYHPACFNIIILEYYSTHTYIFSIFYPITPKLKTEKETLERKVSPQSCTYKVQNIVQKVRGRKLYFHFLWLFLYYSRALLYIIIHGSMEICIAVSRMYMRCAPMITLNVAWDGRRIQLHLQLDSILHNTSFLHFLLCSPKQEFRQIISL